MTMAISGTVPSGEQFEFVMRRDQLALRVDERICVVHPRWMSREQAREVAQALLQVAGEP